MADGLFCGFSLFTETDHLELETQMRRLSGVIALILIVALFVGLLVANYRAALALMVGVALAFAVQWVWTRFTGRTRLLVLSLMGVVVLGAACLLITMNLQLEMFGAAGGSGDPPEGVASFPEISRYRVTIEPATASNTFTVNESIVYNVLTPTRELIASDQVMPFPPRQITSESKGFLLREVILQPLDAAAAIEITLPDGSIQYARLCTPASCTLSEIEVRGFPEGAFYEARETSEIERIPYVGDETITWSTRRIERGIAFSYVPAPFTTLRGIAGPLLGASNLSEWAAGLFGMVASAAAIPLLKPLVVDIAEDKASARLKKVMDKRKKTPAPPKSPPPAE
jgi:hypothetical protein